MDLAVYAVDVGSIARKRLGWARAYAPDGKVDPEAQETDIERLVDTLAADLLAARAVALGFECPLYVPVPGDGQVLGKARIGEGNRSWSAGAGSGALATGLVQACWVLRALRERVSDVPALVDWPSFQRSEHGLFLWEAFVSAKAKATDLTHHGDAAIAVERFFAVLPDPTTADELDAPSPFSLIGAALVWSGWSNDVSLLRSKCLVVKALTA
jgi:hypothetical protein